MFCFLFLSCYRMTSFIDEYFKKTVEYFETAFGFYKNLHIKKEKRSTYVIHVCINFITYLLAFLRLGQFFIYINGLRKSARKRLRT